ncbi:MAG: hypothetical protein K0R17_2332 [Rariglobus sp.]|jgi:hypothetical protein|nr:hypothetical protein [Rariglobus sp.]
MARLIKPLIATLALAGGTFLFSGCATKTEADSSIPWSRPASWEGGIPGMGGMGSPGSGYR